MGTGRRLRLGRIRFRARLLSFGSAPARSGRIAAGCGLPHGRAERRILTAPIG
jgi:hypothetical protein